MGPIRIHRTRVGLEWKELKVQEAPIQIDRAGDMVNVGWRQAGTPASGTAAADAVPMPKPKPRAMRVQLVVPLIRSGEVTWAQWSGVRHRKDALQPLDFSNGLLGVHSVSISNISTATVKRDGINEVSASGVVGNESLVFINTSSTLGPRLIFRMHRRRSRPDRTHQL